MEMSQAPPSPRIYHAQTASEGNARVHTAFLSVYLLATAFFYNDFFHVNLSSRIPLLLSLCIFAPLLLGWLAYTNRIYISRQATLGKFLACYLLIEIVQVSLGSNEFLCIASIMAILIFLQMSSAISKQQLMASLMTSSLIYFFTIYPLAYLHGMVGNDPADAGVFVPQFIPELSPFTLNGYFMSGRGVAGMLGGAIALLSIIQIRSNGIKPGNAITLLIGLFELLVSDSRGPILSFVLVLSTIYFPVSRILRVRMFFLIPVMIVLFQGLICLTAYGISELTFDLGMFSRKDLSVSDSTRSLAWKESINLITDGPRSLMIGRGAVGSANALEQTFSQRYPDIEQITSSHNLFLQLALDGGAILLLVFIFYVAGISKYGRQQARNISLQDTDAVAVLAFVLINGFTGSVIGVDRVNESMFLFVLLFAAIDKQIKYGTSQSSLIN